MIETTQYEEYEALYIFWQSYSARGRRSLISYITPPTKRHSPRPRSRSSAHLQHHVEHRLTQLADAMKRAVGFLNNRITQGDRQAGESNRQILVRIPFVAASCHVRI